MALKRRSSKMDDGARRRNSIKEEVAEDISGEDNANGKENNMS